MEKFNKRQSDLKLEAKQFVMDTVNSKVRRGFASCDLSKSKDVKLVSRIRKLFINYSGNIDDLSKVLIDARYGGCVLYTDDQRHHHGVHIYPDDFIDLADILIESLEVK